MTTHEGDGDAKIIIYTELMTPATKRYLIDINSADGSVTAIYQIPSSLTLTIANSFSSKMKLTSSWKLRILFDLNLGSNQLSTPSLAEYDFSQSSSPSIDPTWVL